MIKVFLWGKKRKNGPFTLDNIKGYKFRDGFLCISLLDGKYIEHFEVEVRKK